MTSTQTRDLSNLHAVVDYIVEHPEQHKQDVWLQIGSLCGTQMCVAGAAVWLDPLARTDIAFSISGRPIWATSGEEIKFFSEARRRLNLTSAEASVLFEPYNTIDDILVIVAALDNGEEINYYWAEQNLSWFDDEDNE